MPQELDLLKLICGRLDEAGLSSKLAWAKEGDSKLQINDIKNLFQSKHEIDMMSLQKWIDALDLNEVYEKVRTV